MDFPRTISLGTAHSLPPVRARLCDEWTFCRQLVTVVDPRSTPQLKANHAVPLFDACANGDVNPPLEILHPLFAATVPLLSENSIRLADRAALAQRQLVTLQARSDIAPLMRESFAQHAYALAESPLLNNHLRGQLAEGLAYGAAQQAFPTTHQQFIALLDTMLQTTHCDPFALGPLVPLFERIFANARDDTPLPHSDSTSCGEQDPR